VKEARMSLDVNTDESPAEFDPFSETFFDDPSDLYRRMRDESPVYFNERYGFWALFLYDDVARAHKDWQTFSSTRGVDLSMLTGQRQVPESIIMMDPPQHDRLRALVSRVFTPRAVAALEPMVREVVGSYLDDADRNQFDMVADFAGPFPVEVISRMLGVPPADRQQIRHWLDIVLTREPGNPAPTPAGEQAMVELGTFFWQLVRDKRQHPADDMLTRLTEVEVDRGDGRTTKLDDGEVAGFASLLAGAGAETVTKLVGSAVVLFHRNPAEWHKVLADRSAIPRAVEEVLRCYPPSQYQGRYSVRAAEYSGVTIPPGYPVLLVSGSATRDERQYDDPDRFDIDRTQGLALGFGYGIHSCLGAALARLESRIAVEELATRYPRYQVDEAGCRRVHMSNVAGYSNVPVRVLR
jgi:cytochrome P450